MDNGFRGIGIVRSADDSSHAPDDAQQHFRLRAGARQPQPHLAADGQQALGVAQLGAGADGFAID